MGDSNAQILRRSHPGSAQSLAVGARGNAGIRPILRFPPAERMPTWASVSSSPPGSSQTWQAAALASTLKGSHASRALNITNHRSPAREPLREDASHSWAFRVGIMRRRP